MLEGLKGILREFTRAIATWETEQQTKDKIAHELERLKHVVRSYIRPHDSSDPEAQRQAVIEAFASRGGGDENYRKALIEDGERAWEILSVMAETERAAILPQFTAQQVEDWQQWKAHGWEGVSATAPEPAA